MDMVKMGSFLAELRKEQKLTQAELGEKLGVTNKTVSRWETGTYVPPVEILEELSRLYGLTINEILSGRKLTTEEYKEMAESNIRETLKASTFELKEKQTSVYKGYKQDKIEMRGDRAEMSDFPLYLNTVAGGLDRRDQTIGGFSFVVKIYAVPVVEIIGQLLYLLGRYGFNAQFGDCL